MCRLTTLIALAFIALLLAVACGGDGSSPTPSPTPSPAVSLPSPTPATTPTATPTPAPKEVDGPVPLRTGIAELDVIIHGFVEHDTKRLLSLLRYQTLPCTTEDTTAIGGVWLCRPDEEDGTPVEVMPVIGCARSFPRPHEFEMTLIRLVEQDLYGVYAGRSILLASGEYVVLLSMPLSTDDNAVTAGTGVLIEDGLIVGVYSGCVASPEELVETDSLGEPLFRPDGQ